MFDDKIAKIAHQGHIVPTHNLIKNAEQIEKIKESAKINIAVLDEIQKTIHEGMSTAEIDKIVYDMTTDMGGIPAPLNYEGFPYSVCTSVNDQVCHGFPSPDVILKSGDIINVDCSTILNGYFSDSSRMFCIGEVDDVSKKLVEDTLKAVQLGLSEVRPFNRLGNVGALINSVQMTRTEAGAAFGNPTVYMEKYLEQPRHIEIQVLADEHGNAIYLGERDCSMQRRHQKIIEEAPAPGITDKQRKHIGEACAAACRKIGYRGAGTFEFLFENNEFYFIEMNTRVQVEHPVTELITGIDIVQEQIRVAAGQKLRYTQKQVQLKGHSMECRINAEDPFTFVPSPGRIDGYHPPGGPGIRVDSHIYHGYTVPPYYDSMIAKLIAYGDTREQAMARLRVALSEMAIGGIKTNIPLHQELLVDSAFIQGGTSIHYLEARLAKLKKSEA
jgi:acetyl-CoA carboxylase biotin carboxylase subunit